MKGYTQTELDMARKGYVYFSKVEGAGCYRKRVKRIDELERSDLIFDWPAYKAHHVAR